MKYFADRRTKKNNIIHLIKQKSKSTETQQNPEGWAVVRAKMKGCESTPHQRTAN